MRILVVGQPASGLFILSKYLIDTFNLIDLNTGKIPDNEKSMISFINSGNFPDNAILTQHLSWNPDLIKACREIDCQILCAIKHPYETFEMMHKIINANPQLRPKEYGDLLFGNAIDSEEVTGFISEHHTKQIALTESWIKSGNAHIVMIDKLCHQDWKELHNLCNLLNTNDDIDIFKNTHIFDDQCNAIKNSTFIDTNLPDTTIRALNNIIPKCIIDLGYELSEPSPDKHLTNRLKAFSNFIDQHSNTQRIFIVGNGKSGTTWLHLIFFHHPNTGATAERRLIEHPDNNTALFDILLNDNQFNSWFSSSSFGKTCSTQQHVRYEMARILSDYLVYRALAGRKTNKGFRRKTDITHFSEKIALNTTADAISTISNLKQIYPSAKVIHIIRDPRDVAISTLYHLYRNSKENAEKNWITNFVECGNDRKLTNLYSNQRLHHFFMEQAGNWNDIVSTFHTVGTGEFEDRYCSILYEDLLNDPSHEIRRLFDFCELENSNDLIEQIINKTSFQALTRGRESGTENTSSFYRKGISGDWANYLTDREAAIYFTKAKDTMSLFGYK